MQDIPLVSEDDMISSRKKEKGQNQYKEKGETRRLTLHKPEKPIRIVRIKYYQKISVPCVQSGGGKVGQKDAFAVDRSLEDLLKALYYNTGIQKTIVPDCIFVEKDDRMGSNNKFIFIEINRGEFDILKRQLENHTTVSAYNRGELLIMEGKRSSLAETLNMPRIWKSGWEERGRQISDTNVILMRARLREELKDVLAPYHSYTDEQIDSMKESELIALKKLSNRKMAIENKKRKKVKKLLR